MNTNLSNPNGIGSSTVTAGSIFAQSAETVGRIINQKNSATDDNFDYAMEWMHYSARANGWQSDGHTDVFVLTNAYKEGIWPILYHNIFDLNFVTSKAAPTSVLNGAAAVLKILDFQMLVDNYGNVPYSQAANPTIATLPAYDDAATIYKNFIPKLDSAIISLKASTSSSDDASDIVFAGNKTKWIQFANTLKLRILMRQSSNNADINYVKTGIANIVAEGDGFLPAGADVAENPGYLNANGQQSPIWSTLGTTPTGTPQQTFYRADSMMTDFLTNTSDPRLSQYFVANGAGGYSGNYLGDNTVLNTVSSAIGTGILQSATQSAVIMSSSEGFFLQAEAVQRGLLTSSSSAAMLYQQGVEESFRYAQVPNAITAADNMIATSTSPYVNFTSSPLTAIGYQKWVALCGQLNGLEAWCEYRRTGLPVINNPSHSPGVATNVIPKRLLYPQTEYDVNTANVTAAGNGITIYTSIFWGQ